MSHFLAYCPTGFSPAFVKFNVKKPNKVTVASGVTVGTITFYITLHSEKCKLIILTYCFERICCYHLQWQSEFWLWWCFCLLTLRSPYATGANHCPPSAVLPIGCRHVPNCTAFFFFFMCSVTSSMRNLIHFVRF